MTPEGKEYQLSSKPYSPKYAKEKGVSPTAVDLTLTGDMLENMFVKGVAGNKITVSVRERDYGKLRGAEEGILRSRIDRNGKPIKGSATLLKRPFFNLSENDKREIVGNNDFQNILNRAINRELSKKK